MLGAAICIFLAVLVLFRRHRREMNAVEMRQKTPKEIAHEAFAVLLSEQLPAAGRIKDFYLRLTGIVRVFIEGTTGLRAPEQTTEEFLHVMRSRDVFSAKLNFAVRSVCQTRKCFYQFGLSVTFNARDADNFACSDDK